MGVGDDRERSGGREVETETKGRWLEERSREKKKKKEEEKKTERGEGRE